MNMRSGLWINWEFVMQFYDTINELKKEYLGIDCD